MNGIVGDRLAYRGKRGCQSVTCTRRDVRAFLDGRDDGPCYGWHCANCDGPSSYQGHTRIVDGELRFTCEPPTRLEEPS